MTATVVSLTKVLYTFHKALASVSMKGILSETIGVPAYCVERSNCKKKKILRAVGLEEKYEGQQDF